MIVVADAGPIHYLVLIGAVDLLQPLYSRVLTPRTVAEELQGSNTPNVIRVWITQPPEWFEIRADPPAEPGMEFLDAGERAAITLAVELGAERLLIDDWEGRAEAVRRHLRVTGTLGILVEAHRRHLLDFEASLSRLLQTNFYISEELLDRIRRRLRAPE